MQRFVRSVKKNFRACPSLPRLGAKTNEKIDFSRARVYNRFVNEFSEVIL